MFHMVRTTLCIPHVSVLRDNSKQDFLALTGDHQGRARDLDRLRTADRIADVVMLAVKSELAIMQHPLDYPARFIERLETFRRWFEIEAEARMLQLEPSRSQPEDETPFACVVESRGHLRGEGWIAKAIAVHQASDTGPA